MDKLLSMMFPRGFIFCVCFIYMLLNIVHAKTNTQENGIEVKGQASVLVEPDSFSLSIAIVEVGRITDKIRAIVDHKSNQVVNIVRQLGVKTQNINSARVSLRVITGDPRVRLHEIEINENLPSNQKSKLHVGVNPSKHASSKSMSVRPQYFELSRRITVNFSDIKSYDQFLNKIIKVGVSQISTLTMSVKDTDQYYQQALLLAIKDATIKAEKIAGQVNQNLGKLLYVKELSSNHYRSSFNSEMLSMTPYSGHSSQVSNQVINASVLVKYVIE